MPSYVLDNNPENLTAYKVTIKSGASLSDGVYTQGHALVGIQMPASWTAASLGYEVSVDDLTYQTGYDTSGNLEQTIVIAGCFVCVPLSDAIFAPYFKIRSVAAANPPVTTPVNQDADRTLILLFKRYLGGS